MMVFKDLDTTGSGKLGTAELIAGCQKNLGVTLPQEEMKAIIDRVDADGNGYIDYTEFLVAAINRERLLSKEHLESAF